MELLSPAGSMDALKAAVQNGADAVYLGGEMFNARYYANNIADLEQAVAYAHLRRCQVYFVLNTLLLDRELKDWSEQARAAAAAGVDAFIIQDIGGASILKQICPDIPLHASTQMTVHNAQTASCLGQFGFERIILARELTKKQITHITAQTNIQTEVFVHGALCVAYSGQCLMSSMLGGRSANRGMCAQPCRLQYSSGKEPSHMLSTKDLCLVNHIEDLQQTGVASLKIEGRMKRPEYVAAVTRVYRKALDGFRLEQRDYDMLALAFNRGGFTTNLFDFDEHRLYTDQPGHIGLPAGHIQSVSHNSIHVQGGRPLNKGDEVAPARSDASSAEIQESQHNNQAQRLQLSHTDGFAKGQELRQTKSAVMDEELLETVRSNHRQYPLYADITIRSDEKPTLKTCTSEGICSTATSDRLAEPAVHRSLTEEDVKRQLDRTGEYPFFFKEIAYDLTPDTAFPVSGLNALRREVLADISEQILDPYRHQTMRYRPLPSKKRHAPTHPLLVAEVATKEQARAVLPYVDELYLPLSEEWVASFAANCQKPVSGVYPLITQDEELPCLHKKAEAFSSAVYNSFLSTHADVQKIANYGLNVMNSESLFLLKKFGFKRVTLSQELNLAQIRDLVVPDGLMTEAVAYGRSVLMVTEHCPFACKGEHCPPKTGSAFLTDRMGAQFPVIHTGSRCRVKLLNSVPIYMADQLHDLPVDCYRMIFTIEDADESRQIAHNYNTALQLPTNQLHTLAYNKKFTRGHFGRGVEGYT